MLSIVRGGNPPVTWKGEGATLLGKGDGFSLLVSGKAEGPALLDRGNGDAPLLGTGIKKLSLQTGLGARLPPTDAC